MGAHFSGLSLKKWPPGRAAFSWICGLHKIFGPGMGLKRGLFWGCFKYPAFEGVVILDGACSRFYDTKIQNFDGFLYHQTIGI
jgi:hypothetical protein